MTNSNLRTENHFDYVKISIASPQRIMDWGQRTLPNGQVVGEVTKPETINYRTLKPEMDGLFCEKIFGPSKDWECHCGKYKRVRHRGIVCERCGVEVTESRVRRHRMGYIKLAAPVSHVWYLKGIPSYVAILLDIPLRDVEQIVYFNCYVVLDPGDHKELKYKQLLTEDEWLEIEDEIYAEDSNIEVSAFIDPLGDKINYSKEIGINYIELHTGKYAELSGSDQYKELQKIIESTYLANDLGLVVNAGHGLNYNYVKKFASFINMNELNIGHSIVARALAVGLEKSVREMKSLITLN